MDLEKLYLDLNQSGYVCDPPFAAKVFAATHTSPQAGAFLFGPAGTGKTFLPDVLARILDAELVFQQCFPGTREEDLMVRMVPCDEAKSGIRAVDGVVPEAFELLKTTKRTVVLCLDEFDKTRPSADAFLLDLLQSGRVRYAGRNLQLTSEERSRFTVFVTMNDERDLSEPLLRRLPKIDFPLLPSPVVRTALDSTHGGHPLIEPCITLYRRCLAAKLPKPCTLQELRQLIDAADLLGRFADWDALVYQFITKTPEQHSLLADAETIPLPPETSKMREIDPKAYGFSEPLSQRSLPRPKMPSLLSAARKLGLPEGADGEAGTETAGGVVKTSESAYDALLDWAGPPNRNPAEIGTAGRLVGKTIVLEKPFLLAERDRMEKLWGEAGEVAFLVPAAEFDEVMDLRAAGWKVVSYANDRLVAKTEGLDLSWRQGEGVEIIVGLQDRDRLESFLEKAPASWSSQEGRIASKTQGKPGAARRRVSKQAAE